MATRIAIASAFAAALLYPQEATAVQYKQCDIRSTKACHVQALPGAASILSFRIDVRGAYTVQQKQKFAFSCTFSGRQKGS